MLNKLENTMHACPHTQCIVLFFIRIVFPRAVMSPVYRRHSRYFRRGLFVPEKGGDK